MAFAGGYPNSGSSNTLDAARIGGGAVSNTEFGYLDGVTSAIQTQLNTIPTRASILTSSLVKYADGSGNLARAAIYNPGTDLFVGYDGSAWANRVYFFADGAYCGNIQSGKWRLGDDNAAAKKLEVVDSTGDQLRLTNSAGIKYWDLGCGANSYLNLVASGNLCGRFANENGTDPLFEFLEGDTPRARLNWTKSTGTLLLDNLSSGPTILNVLSGQYVRVAVGGQGIAMLSKGNDAASASLAPLGNTLRIQGAATGNTRLSLDQNGLYRANLTYFHSDSSLVLENLAAGSTYLTAGPITGTNVPGGEAIIRSGLGTGTGSSVGRLQAPVAQASGSTAQTTWADALTWDRTKVSSTRELNWNLSPNGKLFINNSIGVRLSWDPAILGIDGNGFHFSGAKTLFGSAGGTPSKLVELIDSTADQLRLTHTYATKYGDIGVDTFGVLNFRPTGAEMSLNVGSMANPALNLSQSGSIRGRLWYQHSDLSLALANLAAGPLYLTAGPITGTNVPGGEAIIRSGLGAGTGSSVGRLQAPVAQASGSAVQTAWADVLTWDRTKVAIAGSAYLDLSGSTTPSASVTSIGGSSSVLILQAPSGGGTRAIWGQVGSSRQWLTNSTGTVFGINLSSSFSPARPLEAYSSSGPQQRWSNSAGTYYADREANSTELVDSLVNAYIYRLDLNGGGLAVRYVSGSGEVPSVYSRIYGTGASAAGGVWLAANTTAGNKIGATYYDGTNYRSAWEVASASGTSTLKLMRGGGSISEFGGTGATQSTGWAVTNPSTRKTFDTTTVTVVQLAEVVGTLVDLLISRGTLAA